jgi:WG containing repeat
MKRRFVAILLWYAALFVVAATGWSSARAQAPATTPTAEPRLRQGSPHLLRAVRAATVARALADEDRASKDGTYTPVSFPLPMCIFDGGLCGALNRDGTVAVTPQFDWVGTFREGRALVRSGGLYGYVDTAGRVVAEPKYELAGNYWRGFAEISIDGKSGLIDLEGNRVLEPRFARAHPFSADVFWVNDGARHYDGQPGVEELVNYEHSDVTRDVSATGKWGLVDRTGTWIRKPEFPAIMRYDRDDSSLVLVKADTGWGVIKTDGTWFLEPKFEFLGRPGSGPAPARVAGRSGYIDRSGTFVIAPTFDDAGHFGTDGLATASIGKLSGLIDRTGTWVIEPRYDGVSHGLASYQGLIWVRLDRKWGAIDRSGQVVVRPQFSQGGATVCDDGWVIGYVDRKRRAARREGAPPLAIPDGELSGTDCEQPFQIRIDDRFGYVDRMQKPITEVKFESLSEFFRGIALVKLDGRFGYIKQDGTWLVEPRFEEASPFWADFTAVKLNGKFGCIKQDGTWLIEPRFAEAPRSCSDLITKIDGKFSFMNPDGTWSIDPRFERVSGFGELDAIKIDGKFGVMDNTGTWLIEPRWRGYGIAVTSGLVAAKFEEKWGFIDASGALVIEDRYDEFSYFQRGISWVKADTWCAIDRRGRKVPTLPCLEADPRPKAGTLTGRFRGY